MEVVKWRHACYSLSKWRYFKVTWPYLGEWNEVVYRDCCRLFLRVIYPFMSMDILVVLVKHNTFISLTQHCCIKLEVLFGLKTMR